MRPLRRVLRAEPTQIALGWLIARYIRLVAATGRWRTLRGDIPTRLGASGRPLIAAFWHGGLLMMPTAWVGGPVDVLISGHRDGRLIARAMGHFAMGTIAGSSRRGGTEALRAMLRSLAGGRSVVVTPDGPRGPGRRVGGAIVDLARLSGAPIVPAALAVSRRWVAPSWDRFVVALPFARGAIVYGDPIEVPRDAGADALEAARLLLECRLNDLGAEADGLVGRPVTRSGEIQPA